MPLFTLRSDVLEVQVASYGARLVSVTAPDRDGRTGHVVLGCDDEDGYRGAEGYLGASVGRVGGRIAGGVFELDGRRYEVPCNESAAARHGGPGGFDEQVWEVEPGSEAGALTFALTSPDGDNGFPGTLRARATYAVDGADLLVEYSATTDAPTPVNLLNHAYYNLSGTSSAEEGPLPSVRDHVLRVRSGRYLVAAPTLLPTGEVADVTGTPLDLRRPVLLGNVLSVDHPQLRAGQGMDHTLVLDPADALDDSDVVDGMALAAELSHPASGRALRLFTDQPALQVYTGGQMTGSLRLRGGLTGVPEGGLCLEAQGYPDAVNQPHFPSMVLRPGEAFRSRTLLRFGTD